MSEWQPMEIAPHDREIIATDGMKVEKAKWGSLYLMEQRNGKYEEKFGFVIEHTQFAEIRATHWMPLPKPPGASE